MSNIASERRVIISHYQDVDTVLLSESGKVINVWDLIVPDTVQAEGPLERKFYARTTPFGVNHYVAEDMFRNRVFELGTTVILDTVYTNVNFDTNRYGYNTIDSAGYPLYEYYSEPRIPVQCVTCVPGNVYTTPGTSKLNGQAGRFEGIKINAESGDTMVIKRNKRLYVIGVDPGTPTSPAISDTLHFKSGSKLIMEEGAEVASAFGGVLIDESGDVDYALGSCFYAFENSTVEIRTNKTVNNGALLVAGRNGTLKIADNTTVTIDGADSRFVCLPGANVVMGNNSKIIVKNGAYVYADSTSFTSSGIWEGIYFENAGSSTDTSKIQNSTFINANIPIKIYNTSTATANNNIVIKNNTITVPYAGSYGIYADNANKLLIQANNISTNSGNMKPCIYIKHPYAGDGLPGGGASPSYSLNIINNTFSNTNAAMIFAGYTSAFVPYYIYGNTGSIQGYGMIGRRIEGTIKNNNISSSGIRNFLIHQSNPDFYNNVIKSTHSTNGRGLVLLSESSPKLAPYIPNEQDFVWQAGNNHVEGTEFAIEINYANSILLDYGQNTLRVANGFNNKHLYGVFTPVFSLLNARNNCWELSGSNNLIWNSQGQITVNDTITSSLLCRSITPTSSTVTDMGNGIFDTVWIAESDAMPGTIDEDEMLYGLAAEYSVNTLYLDAISSYKTLIDEHTESDYLLDALYELYSCHTSLDTFSNQSDRNIHYGALKTYLEACISSGNYDSKFNEDAYNTILMCEGNMQDFESQVTGYEFLALYHPDPESRLMASTDLAIVEDLLEGEGSGNSNLTAEQKLQKIKFKIDRLILNDPILNKVKKSFDKIRLENKKNLDNSLKSKYGREKADLKLAKIKREEERIDNRVRENISLIRTLSKEEKEHRNFETIMILASIDNNGSMDDNPTNILPESYSLSQNYPNPFNPSTNIAFSIPKDMVVKIKIYDIAGREISTLVNKLKTAGNHSISFNGFNLSSGVYFYKIEAGSFVETKRMVLVK